MRKLIPWTLICVLWSPFEMLYIISSKSRKVSRVGVFLVDKIIENEL